WERRDEDTVGMNQGIPNPININRTMTTAGFLGGADVTYRTGAGVWMFGLLGGYMSSNVRLTSSAVGQSAPFNPGDDFNSNASSYSIVHATISGPSVGAYANYASGPWSADLAVKADFLTINEWFNDSYVNPTADMNVPLIIDIPGSASVNMINIS